MPSKRPAAFTEQETKTVEWTAASPVRSGPENLSLYVVGDGVFTVHPLPPGRALVIGRAGEVDLRIDDAAISRKHARIHTGPPLAIEDLGSANGTRVGERRLEPGEVVEIAPGKLISIGSITLLVLRTGAAIDSGAPHGAPPFDPARRDVVVSAPEMQQLYQLVDRIANSPISVFIFGETGVGKEVMAETLHRRSPRADKPFLRLNCGALSDSLLESELFGHEKGAFTGAIQTKIGLLESADGGTVFLDEIGEMPAQLQVKLLRVIEERQIMRVGALRSRPVDVRFIAATHRDLEGEVARGSFRQDLFFRLNGISLTIPPLRMRVPEIEGLARLFIVQACQRARRTLLPRLSDEALALLKEHDWPGNIRELRNLIERAVVLCEGDTITREHLPVEKMGPYSSRSPASLSGERVPSYPSLPHADPESPTISQREPTPSQPGKGDAAERQRIIEALERCAGNQTHAARLLGISRGTLLSRLDLYDIPRPRSRRGDQK